MEYQETSYVGLHGHIVYFNVSEQIDSNIDVDINDFTQMNSLPLEAPSDADIILQRLMATLQFVGSQANYEMEQLKEKVKAAYDFHTYLLKKYKEPSEDAKKILKIGMIQHKEEKDIALYKSNFLKKEDALALYKINRELGLAFHDACTSIMWIFGYAETGVEFETKYFLIQDFIAAEKNNDALATSIAKAIFKRESTRHLFEHIAALHSFFISYRRLKKAMDIIQLSYPTLCVFDAPIAPNKHFLIRNYDIRQLVYAFNNCLKDLYC